MSSTPAPPPQYPSDKHWQWDGQQWSRYFPNQRRTRVWYQLLGYGFLLALALIGMAAIPQLIQKGTIRLIAYAVVLLMAYVMLAWIAASGPSAMALIVSPTTLWWRDQRLRGHLLERRQVASIQGRTVQIQGGRKMSGNWLVDVGGRAQFRLSTVARPADLAEALGVEHLVFPQVLSGMAALEVILPGATDLVRARPLWKYIIPVGVGIAAVTLNQLT